MSSFFSQVELYWEKNPNLPLLEYGKRTRYTVSEAINVIMCRSKKEKICRERPLRVRKNAAFLVDVKSLKHWEDIKDDMNGYNKVLRCGVWTVQCDVESDDHVVTEVIAKKRVELDRDNKYHMIINSKGNKVCPDLERSIFVLQDGKGEIVNGIALLQYHISSDAEEVDFKVQSHGNKKKNTSTPFYPTAKSTMQAIKVQLKEKPPSQAFKAVSGMAGGPAGAKSAGELPRSRKQVYDVQANSKRDLDPVEDLIVYARHKDEKVVLRHEDMPLDLWVLGTDIMCKDLVRFSCSGSLSHPLSIDPTFNMGQYEVTPVVYKQLFLRTKRYGQNPVFLGPTMLHHKKNFDTYKVLASTCVSNCKGLSEAKGFITDGEEELFRAWKTELPKATHLRCIRHFQSNCKQKLREIGIREAKPQKVFLDKVFGIPGKEEGIVDVESKKEVKEQLRIAKKVFDGKEKEILQKQSTYQPLFSKYLDERKEVIAKTMTLSARRKAGMPNDSNGKPLRPYTNGSEAMNNVLLQTKESYLRDQKKPETAQLSKLEFTKNIFEEVHRKQQEELALAVIGLSDQYELTKVAAHLTVPPDVWFEWPEAQRNEYLAKFNLISVDDALAKKTISVTDSTVETDREFLGLSDDLSSILVSKKGYKEEVARAVEDGALMLLNCPSAIQKQPTLDEKKAQVKFEVASKSAKYGRVECTVHASHVSCRCPSFKSDQVCRHAVAVAEKSGILRQHLGHICKDQGQKGQSRTALAEAFVNKSVAGKKGSTNKFHYRPHNANCTTENAMQSQVSSGNTTHVYSEIYHNDNPFVLCMLPPEAKTCKGCKHDFCHRQKIIPYDLVFEHKERYYFPLQGDWKNKIATNKEATRYYHADPKCIMPRFPYFTIDYIEIPSEVKTSLQESHKVYLKNIFSLNI